MTLETEIDEQRRIIQTDSYPISVGELISMYNEKELFIHPDFQRYIRWKPDQKAKFIESMLLGIPIPPIFVSQEPDGVWDVIDGLQRLATIFGFVGCLIGENGVLPAEKIADIKLPYLPSLKGRFWKNDDEKISLTEAQRLFIKRGKLNVQIVKRESNPNFKYELFKRLNSLGSQLSDQELRTCVFLMKDKELFKFIDRLSKYPSFINCIDLSEKDELEKYDQEIVSRFFVIKNAILNDIRKEGNFAEFISDFLTKNWWGNKDYNIKKEEAIFKKTFDLLDATLKSESFKKYNPSKEGGDGRFIVSAFEAIAIGLAKNIDSWELTEMNKESLEKEFREKVKILWNNPKFTSKVGAGVKFNTRTPTVVPIGINLFHKT